MKHSLKAHKELIRDGKLNLFSIVCQQLVKELFEKFQSLHNPLSSMGAGNNCRSLDVSRRKVE